MAKTMLRNRKGRKSNSSKIPCNESSNECDNCVICLDEVDCRGKLGVCEHWFCFPCIFEWSKNTNTCPVCKKKFRCITKTHLKQGKSPVQRVRVGDIDQRVWNDDEDLVISSVLDSDDDDLDILSVEDSDDDDDDDSNYGVDISDYEESSSFVNVFMAIHEYGCDDSWFGGGSDSDDSSLTSGTCSEDSSSNLSSSTQSESTDHWSPQKSLTPIANKKIKVTQKSATINSSDSDKDMEWDEPLGERWKRLANGGAAGNPHRSTTEKSSTGSRNSQPTSSGQNSRETSKRGESSSRKKEKQKNSPSKSSTSLSSTKKNTPKSKTRRQSSIVSTAGQWLNVKRKVRGRPSEHSASGTASTAGQWLDARSRRAESRANGQPTQVMAKPRDRSTEHGSTASTAGQWLDARSRRAESRANRQSTQEKPRPRGRPTEHSCTTGQWLDARSRHAESRANGQPTQEKPRGPTEHSCTTGQWLDARTHRAESRKRGHYSTHTCTTSNEPIPSKNVTASTSSNEPSTAKGGVLSKAKKQTTRKAPVQPVDSDSETSDEVLVPSRTHSARRWLNDSPIKKKTKYKTRRQVLKERQNIPDED